MGVSFDAKMTLINIFALDLSRAAAQRRGIMRKSFQEFHDQLLLLRSLWSLVLPVLEYC